MGYWQERFWSARGGLNSSRQSFVRVIPAYTEAVAAGARHSLVVMRDGGVWTTGYNLYGQLGDGSRTHRNMFVSVINGGDTVAAGGEHSMVLKKDGSVWTAGLNSRGQLGDGSDRLRTTFAQVISSGCRAIAAGSYHSMVLKQDGSVWVTGGNTYGQLGDRSTTTRTTFVQVVARSVEAISFEMAVFSRVQAIAAGHDHSMILKQDGSVWVTGRNNFGQLGDGTRRLSNTFVEVISSDVHTVAAGDWHSMAWKDDGSLWATGSNLYGQVGDGSTIIKSTFVKVISSPFGTLYVVPSIHLWKFMSATVFLRVHVLCTPFYAPAACLPTRVHINVMLQPLTTSTFPIRQFYEYDTSEYGAPCCHFNPQWDACRRSVHYYSLRKG